MFYSHELLKKKGKFGTIWLAATAPKRLTKPDIVSTDIVKVSTDVLKITSQCNQQKEIRFSLYISSQLLYGLSLVNQKLCNYLLTDVRSLKICFLSSGKLFNKASDIELHKKESKERLNSPDFDDVPSDFGHLCNSSWPVYSLNNFLDLSTEDQCIISDMVIHHAVDPAIITFPEPIVCNLQEEMLEDDLEPYDIGSFLHSLSDADLDRSSGLTTESDTSAASDWRKCSSFTTLPERTLTQRCLRKRKLIDYIILGPVRGRKRKRRKQCLVEDDYISLAKPTTQINWHKHHPGFLENSSSLLSRFASRSIEKGAKQMKRFPEMPLEDLASPVLKRSKKSYVMPQLFNPDELAISGDCHQTSVQNRTAADSPNIILPRYVENEATVTDSCTRIIPISEYSNSRSFANCDGLQSMSTRSATPDTTAMFEILTRNEPVSFEALFDAKQIHKQDVVKLFYHILDLHARQIVRLQQSENYGEIYIFQSKNFPPI